MAKVRSKDVIKKYQDILADLKKREYKPVYLLMGEESYYIDSITDYIANNVLEESQKAFNQLVLYGRDVTANNIVFSAARPPMMAENQVVIVKEAQNIRNLDDLAGYLEKPLRTTILVIAYKGKVLDKRTKAYKSIAKVGEVLETAKMYDNELAPWITSHVKDFGGTIAPNASAILAEYIGSDLSRIANELNKLLTLLPEGNKNITADDIEKNIGISKEYNSFELNKAILNKDLFKATRIINYFAQNPNANPLTLSISALFMQFSKLLKLHVAKHTNKGAQSYQLASVAGIEPFFVQEYEQAAKLFSPSKVIKIIELLREYDMKSKGWNNYGTSDSELLRELVLKIMF